MSRAVPSPITARVSSPEAEEMTTAPSGPNPSESPPIAIEFGLVFALKFLRM